MRELPALTPEQLTAHERFSWMQLSVDELLASCPELMEFSFTPTQRRFTGHFRTPDAGIVVSMTHVENALHRKQLGTASDQDDVVLWATMILLNEAFAIAEADHDHTADCLNDLSFGNFSVAAAVSNV